MRVFYTDIEDEVRVDLRSFDWKVIACAAVSPLRSNPPLIAWEARSLEGPFFRSDLPLSFRLSFDFFFSKPLSGIPEDPCIRHGASEVIILEPTPFGPPLIACLRYCLPKYVKAASQVQHSRSPNPLSRLVPFESHQCDLPVISQRTFRRGDYLLQRPFFSSQPPRIRSVPFPWLKKSPLT